MHTAEIRACLALHRLAKLSSQALGRLLLACPEPARIYQLPVTTLNALNIRPAAQQSLRKFNAMQAGAKIEQDLAYLQQHNIHLLTLNCDAYPQLLRQIPDPPPLLYVKGNLQWLNRPQLAIVGSRNSSRQGRDNAFAFAQTLSRAGFVVTSGLALGIDSASHQGALQVLRDNIDIGGSYTRCSYALGSTVAVLGTGIDQIYPRRNQVLFGEIAQHGALVSEFPLGTGPQRHFFPLRNRIISGMSLGVLVIEAALKSGSLITARLALEQNREVFALPGSIHNPASQGCNWLIQQGAKLTAEPADILPELAGWLAVDAASVEAAPPTTDHAIQSQRPLPPTFQPPPQPVPWSQDLTSPQSTAPLPKLTVEEQTLLEQLGYDPVSLEQLYQQGDWTVEQLSSLLVTLELKGLLENVAGCYQRVV